MRRLVLLLLALTGCSRPHYVDEGAGDATALVGQNVNFQVFEAYKTAPPDCVAILPLAADSLEQGQLVRQSLFAHLATQSKRGVRLERVDHEAGQTAGNVAALGQRLHCGAFIQGKVTEYGGDFLLLYSRVAVGVDLQMIRASDGTILWSGRHVAVSYGGTVPLDLVGVGMSVADAVGNLTNDEQVLRLTDDVARRLVSTIPDNAVTALDDPQPPPQPWPPLVQAERALAAGDHAGALKLAQAVIDGGQDRDGAAAFMKGRVLLLDQDAAGAETAFLLAVAKGGKRPPYLNGVGAAATLRGDAVRALAAYQMAIDADRDDAFAWYNSAVIHDQARHWDLAADDFYGAGLAYLKAKDYAHAERALNDLRDLSGRAAAVTDKIKFLDQSMTQLKPRTS